MEDEAVWEVIVEKIYMEDDDIYRLRITFPSSFKRALHATGPVISMESGRGSNERGRGPPESHHEHALKVEESKGRTVSNESEGDVVCE